MGRGKLFEAWSFRLAQPAPFDDPQYSGAKGVGLVSPIGTSFPRRLFVSASTPK